MTVNLIIFEMFALFTPKKIKIDPFCLLKVRGGGMFHGFLRPDGKMTRDLVLMRKYFLGEHKAVKKRWNQYKEYMCDPRIKNTYARLRDVLKWNTYH